MAQRFVGADREQQWLLPPSVRDWLPADHLAWFVIEVVEQLDLSAIYGAYRADGRGRPPHDPALMCSLLFYNYCVGVRSSRAIERRCVEDIACRVIVANQTPDHATICRFRADHQDALSELFFGVLALCCDAGLVRAGTVAVDSTKLAADASLGANRTRDALRAEAERILQEAAETDAAEDEQFGDRRGDELPAELADPATRAGKIRELLDRADARERELREARRNEVARHQAKQAATGRGFRGRAPRPELSAEEQHELAHTKFNLTDPDSAIVRHRGMLIQGYNVHAAVGDGQIILATSATSSAPDHGQLTPILARTRHNLARIDADAGVDQVLADTGYWHAEQITALQQQGTDVYIPPPRRGVFRQPEAIAMNATLNTDDGKRTYRRRQQIAEPVFAHIKHHRAITRLLRRGKHAVQAELDLIATTHNLLKLWRATPATT
jgi:transposase